jgi:hypothetical protein
LYSKLKEVTVTFGPPGGSPIHLMLVVPNRRQGSNPVLLAMNYFGNHTLVRDPSVRLSTNWMPERGEGVVNHRATEASRGTWVDIWRIEQTIERGYAVATFYNGDIDPDRPDERGLQAHLRPQDPGSDCGTIGAWAWGLQRAVDYIVTDPDLDRNRIIVTAHSRLGKAALLAAALDERIAMAIPHQAGCGGSAPSRTAFAVQDEGAATQLGALFDFFAELPFWKMQPIDGVIGEAAVALAEEGRCHVVYLPRGGRVAVGLTAARGTLLARWFNPHDGTFGPAFTVPGGQSVNFTAPDDHDWTLLVKS